MMKRLEILIGGIGGQGIVYAGQVLSRAAMADYQYVANSASYGAESRGSLTSAEIVLSNEFIDYPHCECPDYLIVMHQVAYNLSQHPLRRLRENALIIINSSLVRASPSNPYQHYTIPATHLAKEKLGDISLSNLIMIGFAAKVSSLVSKEALLGAIEEMVPPSGLVKSQQALELGWHNK